MLGAVTCFVAMAAAVKMLRGGGMGVAEVMVWRMAPGIPFVWLALRATRVGFRPKRPAAVALRSLFGGMAMAAYFAALSVLSLLQQTVLYLTQPVFVAILAPLVLRERLRGAAAVALGVALLGAALVVLPDDLLRDPTHATAHLAIPLVPGLLGLACAVFSAAAHLTIRHATTERPDHAPPDAPETVVFYFTCAVAAGSLVATLASGGFAGTDATLSTTTTLGLVAAMVTAGVAGQLLLSRAYALAHAPAVAIVGYARIPLSVSADIVLWGAVAGLSGWLGAATMLVAGVLLVRSQPKPP